MHIFSTPDFFNQNKIVLCEINGENTLCIRRYNHVKGELYKNKIKQEESVYIELTEMKQISVADDNVIFCSHFKYLGSWVSFLLRDNNGVAKHIASVNASMRAMAYFWDDDHVNVYSRYLMFRVITCNLFLCGCKS